MALEHDDRQRPLRSWKRRASPWTKIASPTTCRLQSCSRPTHESLCAPATASGLAPILSGRSACARCSPPRLPWHAVQTLVELSRVQLALGDAYGAGTLLAEARAVMRVRPCLGVLVDQVAELRRMVASHDEPRSGWSSSLTAAELRLLPLLSTHLTFREIGERLYVSRNTVKTQAISIYRKLDVSSRGDAVIRAGELGLVEVPVNVGDFTLSG